MSEHQIRVARNALSLPNLLTYGRVAAVPVVVGFLFWPEEPWARWSALAIFIVAALTDFFDGYLARPGSSSPRSAACSTRSPTSCWSPPCC